MMQHGVYNLKIKLQLSGGINWGNITIKITYNKQARPNILYGFLASYSENINFIYVCSAQK